MKADAHVWVVETLFNGKWVAIERESYWTKKDAVAESKSFAKVGAVRVRKYVTPPPCGSEGK